MNPYQDLPQTAFWKTAVANRSMFDIKEMWKPKFNIKPHQPIVTYGSCFAQHIGKALLKRKYGWLSTEPPPDYFSEKNRATFNYDIFSSRVGNIYTTSLLKQWTSWALDISNPPRECWEENNRFFDPFRPRIEPDGFATKEELVASRKQTIESFRQSIEKAHYFIFTLGLTESWHHKYENFEYPMCPGTTAGRFAPDSHIFVNYDFDGVYNNLEQACHMMLTVNPNLKFILTVSPVPLTATKSGRHVAVATMGSKSILRAAADMLINKYDFADYFPSFELINSPIFKGVFFEPNQRTVNPFGVNFVMDSFFEGLKTEIKNKKISIPISEQEYISSKNGDEFCDDLLLEAFSKP